MIKKARHVCHYFDMAKQEFIQAYGVQNTSARAVAASARKLLQALETQPAATGIEEVEQWLDQEIQRRQAQLTSSESPSGSNDKDGQSRSPESPRDTTIE